MKDLPPSLPSATPLSDEEWDERWLWLDEPWLSYAARRASSLSVCSLNMDP